LPQSTHNASQFTARFLGTPAIDGPNGAITGGATQRHRLALIGVLALSPRGLLSREKLVGLLWPESDDRHARQSLSTAVHAVRKAFGDDALQSEGDALRLSLSIIQIDVVEFEAALSRGDPAAAVALYAGPFMDGLVVPDAKEFEEWQELQRDRLQRAYQTALEHLADAAANVSDLPAAIRWWRQRLACSPADGRVVLALMAALEQAGDRTGALQAALVHTKLLKDEFDAAPDPDVVEFAERLRRSPITTVRRAETAAPNLPEQSPAAGVPDEDRGGRRFDFWKSRRRIVQISALAIVGIALLLAVTTPWPEGKSTPVSRLDVPEGNRLSRSVVAILPIELWSKDPALAALANGLRESLAQSLHRISGVTVISNPAVRSMMEHGASLDSIAVRFQAGTLITAEIQRVGRMVRVTFGVTDANGLIAYRPSQVERPDSVLHQLQDDFFSEIAKILHEQLGRNVELDRRLPPSVRRDAFLAYYQGDLVKREALANDRAGAAVTSSLTLLARADSLFARSAQAAPDWDLPLVARGWTARDLARSLGPADDTARYVELMNRAIGIADNALARWPENAWAFELRATTRMHLGLTLRSTPLLDQAEQDFVRALDFDPNQSSAWRNLSFLVLQRGRVDESQQHALRALAADPFSLESADLIQRMATNLRVAMRANEANDWCARGVRDHPLDYRFPVCFLAVAAHVWASPLSTEDAERHLRRADALNPQPAGRALSYQPLYRRMLFATIVLRNGDTKGARRVVSRVIDAARNHPDLELPLDYDLAFFELVAGDTARARTLLNGYITRNPQFREIAEREVRWGPLLSAGRRAPG
jgi:DNA-binding SARP family transcriptional activator/TolB-like protein